MSMETGTGAGSVYEYVIAEKTSGLLRFKRISLILLYILWVVGFLAVGLLARIIAPLLAFIPISLWVLIFFTWRYTQVEYEFSFLSGQMTVSRILGGRSRKTLALVTIRELSRVLPAFDSNGERIERTEDAVNAYDAQKTVVAVSHSDSDRIHALLWESDGTRFALWFEADDRALKILKYYNSSAFRG